MPRDDHKVFLDHQNDRQADYQTLMLLTQHGVLQARGDLGRTVLHYAAAYDDPDEIIRLCQAGADVNARASGGEPPLFDALSQPVVQALYAAGADLNAQDHLGHTMLHHKACEGDATALRWLLDLGAAVDRTDHEGNTALHTAAWLGDVDTVDVLVQGGAPLLRLNHRGQTALDIAVESGCQAVVHRLHAATQIALTQRTTPAWLDSLVRTAQGLPPCT